MSDEATQCGRTVVSQPVESSTENRVQVVKGTKVGSRYGVE